MSTDLTPLITETRSAIPTGEAAQHLLRKPQTLRLWALRENGPIRPIRVGSRLAWRVDDIRALLQIRAGQHGDAR